MNKFEELISGEIPVLIDFFATWCGPCKMMQPVLEDLKKDMGDGVHILKIDIDNPANAGFVSRYNVRSVPTLMIFKKGDVVWRNSGFMPLPQLLDVFAGI